MKYRNETASVKLSEKGVKLRGTDVNKNDSVTAIGAERHLFSPDEQNRQVAKAAYFRALERGFAPGCEMDDWLQAETEIGLVMCTPKTFPR